MASVVYHAPAVNVDAVCTIESRSGWQASFRGISWSYSAVPTTTPATLTVQSGSTVLLKWYIVAGGPDSIPLPVSIKANVAENLVATLSAAGAGIFGSLMFTG